MTKPHRFGFRCSLTLIAYVSLLGSSIFGQTTAVENQDGPAKAFLGKPVLEVKPVFGEGRFPNVTVTTAGTVLATFGSDQVWAKRSQDGGQTWSEKIVIAESGIHGGGTTVDETTGDILVFVEAQHPPAPITLYRSSDDGVTWKASDFKIAKDSRGNEPSMHMNEHGITLQRGKHRGRLIRASRDYGEGNRPASLFPTHYTHAILSDDGGTTWSVSEPFPEFGTGEAALVELADGTLYYNTRRHWAPAGKDPLRRWDAISRDGGATWSNVEICQTLPDGPQDTNYGCMGGLVRLPITGQDILLYSNCDSGSGRKQGTVWCSFDGGKTWPLKRRVVDGAFAYSSLAAGRHGTNSEGWVFLHFESEGSKVARFNLSWLLEGEKTGDGIVPESYQPARPAPSKFSKASSVLTKYCAGCHNADEDNGGFRVDSIAALRKGSLGGPVMTPGAAESSLLIALMRGHQEPVMPPEGEPQPTPDEIQHVAAWIDAGAIGPAGDSPQRMMIDLPEIKSETKIHPITALAISPDQKQLAVGRFGSVELLSLPDRGTCSKIEGLPGKVHAIQFFDDGEQLVIGTGQTGVFGEAVLASAVNGTVKHRFRGHRDAVFSVAVDDESRRIATASYDRTAAVWDVASAVEQSELIMEPLRRFRGHNDAVFDVAFDPGGGRLITASADATVKIWDLRSGQRLDTRGEPLEAQLTLAATQDGEFLFAAGEDNRIRKWNLKAGRSQPTTPLLTARFAHESTIEKLLLNPSDEFLISVGADGSIKIWDTATLEQRYQFPKQKAAVQAIAASSDALWVGRMNGTLERLDWPEVDPSENTASTSAPSPAKPDIPVETAPGTDLTTLSEVEPNDVLSAAQHVEIPVRIQGKIDAEGISDRDLFRFKAHKNQRIVIESRAATLNVAGKQDSRSPVDTHIVVMDSSGAPVPRVLLRAVRDSYFTFRGKNSDQANDFRIHNWEEMQLGQLLYCNGEVVKLYHYPRGPDSGFNVYPNFGKRHGMFGTTAMAHALHEPCYIVQPFPPGTELPDNGLPTFELAFENDDDPQRQWGTDSRMIFRAPQDGNYFVQVRDARGFSGPDYQYELTLRSPQPGFQFKQVLGSNPKLIRGGFKKVGVEIDRIDGFDGPVQVTAEGLPAGVEFVGPVSVEPEALRAFFVLKTATETKMKEFAAQGDGTEQSDTGPEIVMTAVVNGQSVVRKRPLGKISFADKVPLSVRLEANGERTGETTADGLPVIELSPGQTTTARIVVQRLGYDGRINFGKEDAAVNSPFGTYVDNTGLNGVLITPDANQREFSLTAEPWMPAGEHLIFVEAAEAGKPASNPMLLRIVDEE